MCVCLCKVYHSLTVTCYVKSNMKIEINYPTFTCILLYFTSNNK